MHAFSILAFFALLGSIYALKMIIIYLNTIVVQIILYKESFLSLADKQYPIEDSLAELKKEKENVKKDLSMLRNEL
jgi:hypothetical protein